MEVFGVAHLKEKTFLQLSSGEQRLCLLARAFVKDPELLILDEPLHGLDTFNRRRVKKIIEAFCHRQDKTLIMVTHYENELPQTITHRLELKKQWVEKLPTLTPDSVEVQATNARFSWTKARQKPIFIGIERDKKFFLTTDKENINLIVYLCLLEKATI